MEDTVFFSPSTGGFYPGAPYGEVGDEVEISAERHQQLIAGQMQGKVIAASADGFPVLADPPPPSKAELEGKKVALVQRHMDATAQALRYDSIANAITYADEPAVPKFQQEGRALRAWRSLVWERCYAILAEVEAGTRPVPSDDELIAALPQLDL